MDCEERGGEKKEDPEEQKKKIYEKNKMRKMKNGSRINW